MPWTTGKYSAPPPPTGRPAVIHASYLPTNCIHYSSIRCKRFIRRERISRIILKSTARSDLITDHARQSGHEVGLGLHKSRVFGVLLVHFLLKL